MPLSKQERRCIDLACRYLGDAVGGDWHLPPGPTLDEQFPNTPTPEAIVTNGRETAAIEVKRLSGDSVMQEYHASLQYLKRDLTPSYGGHYHLFTPDLFTLPMDKKLMRHLKAEIQRVAATMDRGEKRAVCIPRKAVVTVQTWGDKPAVAETVRPGRPRMLCPTGCGAQDVGSRAATRRLSGTGFPGV